MSVLTKGLAKLFGNKSDRDIKEVMPLVKEINKVYESLKEISDDDLRNKTQIFKDRIAEGLSAIDQQLEEQHKNVSEDETLSISEKEAIFDGIDKLEEERNQQLEVILMEILPEAFAVVKETARRFKDQHQMVVTATLFDKQIAASGDHVQIKGDQATWYHQWNAAGNEITWEMLHYDVQLIGGINLHQGKIAEMATGEGKTLVATLPAYLNALPGRGVHVVTVND